MSIDQLLPKILALDPFEREKLLLEISDSLGERDGYFVADSAVSARVAEIDEDPEGSTVSRDEFVSYINSRSNQRRSGEG